MHVLTCFLSIVSFCCLAPLLLLLCVSFVVISSFFDADVCVSHTHTHTHTHTHMHTSHTIQTHLHTHTHTWVNREAGIRVWMVTGDKLSTAKQVSFAAYQASFAAYQASFAAY